MDKFRQEFTEQCIGRMKENTGKIMACLEALAEEDIWRRPNEASNSIGNMILHLCGNIRQYAVSSLGYLPDIRVRQKEFDTRDGFSKDELANNLSATVNEAIGIIEEADEKSLLHTRSVQGFNLTGIGIIIHVTEHYSYHTGQIIFWTKILKNKDLGFYTNIDLEKKNVNSQ